MLDVVAAVHWLRLNAPHFGADAGRLTLIGIGRGATLVHLLMQSPVARGKSADRHLTVSFVCVSLRFMLEPACTSFAISGLFQGAVLLDGAATSGTSLQANAEDVRQQVAATFKCWDPAADANAGATIWRLACADCRSTTS